MMGLTLDVPSNGSTSPGTTKTPERVEGAVVAFSLGWMAIRLGSVAVAMKKELEHVPPATVFNNAPSANHSNAAVPLQVCAPPHVAHTRTRTCTSFCKPTTDTVMSKLIAVGALTLSKVVTDWRSELQAKSGLALEAFYPGREHVVVGVLVRVHRDYLHGQCSTADPNVSATDTTARFNDGH